MVRAFYAVDIRDEETVKNLLAIQNELLRAAGEGLKPVEPENLHITLLFLGELNEEEVSEAQKALSSIEAKPFEIGMNGVGYFPGGGRVNVIWVGVRNGADNLADVHSQLRKRLPRIRVEEQRFIPHLTICRVKYLRNRGPLLEVINRNRDTFFGKQLVTRIVLKKSVLTSSGPVYSDLAVKNL
ncbi:MAG: RNA 2',3'-cyclic phosphodiesterase [Candidatus Caldarchaeum sp.]|jgi:2'-5' RNA ligase|uniref:RNA 2',3'-cyclic phosphodiesterase n=1 Tax=Caldiarchaeum subterraneum TaxID=311458 RepID=A0A7C4DZW0_CALS0|nr:RNA 2',3'-cyclic phosphodiesterase [Candidatus Caldarchaeales archaeon]